MKPTFQLFLTLFILSTANSGFAQEWRLIEKEIRKLETSNCKYDLKDRNNHFLIRDKVSLGDQVKIIEGYKIVLDYKIIDPTKQYLSQDRIELIDWADALLKELFFIKTFNSEDSTLNLYEQESDNEIIYVELFTPLNKRKKLKVTIVVHDKDSTVMKNQSFEQTSWNLGFRAEDKSRYDWNDCAVEKFPGKSPPTLHITNNQLFGNTKLAPDGTQFIAIVTRQDITWESLSNNFYIPLSPETCYSFEIDLVHETNYQSGIPERPEEYHFNQPICLRISLSNEICEPDQVIFESKPISNEEWETHLIEFKTLKSYQYIIMEAFYLTPYCPNGNIMIDNINNFKEVDCN